MSERLAGSLRKVALGTGIAMTGIASGLLFDFIARLIIARYSLETNYGMFSLALAILTLAMTLACLGLHLGATRYIAYFRARNDMAKVRGTIYVSLGVTTIASLVIAVVLFFSSRAIAIHIFHNEQLAQFLRIFALGTPFFTLIYIIAAIFRGFDRVEPQVYFQYLLVNALFIVLLFLTIATGLPFTAVLYAYLGSLIITFIGIGIYTIRKLPRLALYAGKTTDITISKGLMTFSLPLLGTAIFSAILLWMGTLMLGYFKSADVVGLYSAAYPLAQSISSPPFALGLIYTPVVTGLFSLNRITDLKRSYTIVTKWLAFAIMPLFLVLFLYPEYVLSLLFGPDYVPAAPALRILAIGFILEALPGPNAATLIALGESRFLMWANVAATCVSLALNIVLIPKLGIIGAAIASAVSLTIFSIIRGAKVYSLCRAYPFSWNLLKPLAVSIALALLFQLIFGKFIMVTWWMLPLLFALFYAIYGTATVLTRSFDQEDIVTLLMLEKRSGINAEPAKKILRRFI